MILRVSPETKCSPKRNCETKWRKTDLFGRNFGETKFRQQRIGSIVSFAEISAKETSLSTFCFSKISFWRYSSLRGKPYGSLRNLLQPSRDYLSRFGHAAWTCSTDMQIDMHQGQAAWTCTKDMQQGHAARTCSMDKQNGQAAGLCSMDMRHGQAAWRCCLDIQHEHEAKT